MSNATGLRLSQPSTPPLSPADIAAHRAASYIRPRPTVPVSPSANWTICPECGGNLTPDHRCPQKPAPLPSTSAERRAYAARVAAEFGIDAYSLPNLPQTGGAR